MLSRQLVAAVPPHEELAEVGFMAIRAEGRYQIFMTSAIHMGVLPLMWAVLMATAINTGHVDGNWSLIWAILIVTAINIPHINGACHQYGYINRECH